MKKYMILYKGPATPMEDIDQAKGKQIMEAWGKWMDKLGDGLVDIGSPMDPRKSDALKDDGQKAAATELNGYSIIQAKDIGAAMKLVEGHPFLSDNTGNFAVEVFELLPTPV